MPYVIVFFIYFIFIFTSVTPMKVRTRSLSPTATVKAAHDEQYAVLKFCIDLMKASAEAMKCYRALIVSLFCTIAQLEYRL